MVDRHSFPHHPRYYCTACNNLLTAKAARNREAVQTHITNSDDAEHRDRKGSSISAPITTTSVNSDLVTPIWKSEGTTEKEQLIYLALLRYPHLPLGKARTRKDENTSIAELLDTSKRKASKLLFNSPSIAHLRARAAYVYVDDTFTRPIEEVTVDPKERLIHKTVRTLARDTRNCSIKPNGGFKLPTLSAGDIADKLNSIKQLPSDRPEAPAINSGFSISPDEVSTILENTVIEPQLPNTGLHTACIKARLTTNTLKEAASVVSNKWGEEIRHDHVGGITRQRAWRAFDASKLSQLVYDPETVARDFYALLKETNLEPPAAVTEQLPEDATSSPSPTEQTDSNPASAPQANQPQQQSPKKTDGGAKPASAGTEVEPTPISTFTTSKETVDDITTLIKATLTDTTTGSEPADAALNIYEELPEPARKTILTEIRAETSDEIFTALTKRL